MAWKPGQQLQGGNYTIEKKLGEGGFGITYLAQMRNGRRVVIKTLHDELQRCLDFDKLQQDFFAEAGRMMKCSHPHIVKIEGMLQEGTLWCMVMEYIEGEDLASRVVNKGVLPEAEALEYIQQIGEALTVVHKNNLLHRDVKPQNIMLRAGKAEAVLIDFGIAREFTPDLTQTHTEFASNGFAPIEQYSKRAKRGAYTDVYALAATLYAILTNDVPPPASERKEGTSLPSPNSINRKISNKVNQAIIKGMALNGNRRPQSVDEWLGLLGLGSAGNSRNSVTTSLANLSKIISQSQLPWIKISFVLMFGLAGYGLWQILQSPATLVSDQDSPVSGGETSKPSVSPRPIQTTRRVETTPKYRPRPVVQSGGESKKVAAIPAKTIAYNNLALDKTLTGHSKWVSSVAFSPDGQTLASGSSDKTIKIWNVSTGELKSTLTGHSYSVYSVAFSPDGQTLASGSSDKTIKIWNLSTGKLIRTLSGHSKWVSSVAFSPDGQTLASGSSDKTIKIWNLSTGKLKSTLTGHSSDVYSVAFSPDGQTLASGSWDKTIKIWNVSTGELKSTLSGHSNGVNSVAFSPDGQTLASGSNDKTIKIWRVQKCLLGVSWLCGG